MDSEKSRPQRCGSARRSGRYQHVLASASGTRHESSGGSVLPSLSGTARNSRTLRLDFGWSELFACATFGGGRRDMHDLGFLRQLGHASQQIQHSEGFRSPGLIRSFAAMVGDLSEAGLNQEDPVMAFGEFGCTSVINKDAGRDHWLGSDVRRVCRRRTENRSSRRRDQFARGNAQVVPLSPRRYSVDDVRSPRRGLFVRLS